MKSTFIIIIACKELSKNLCYLKQMEYVNGSYVDYINLYACGANNKEEIAPFLTSLMKRYEYTNEAQEKIQKILNFLPKCCEINIIEDLKLSTIRQMPQIRQDSWKYAVNLMDDNRYLILPPEVSNEIDLICQILATSPAQL